VLIERAGDGLRARAWGAGAGWALETLPELLGGRDQPELLEPRHPLIATLVHQRPGLRMTRSGRVFEALLPAIISQKVTGLEAHRSYRRLLAQWGEPAPGPLGLRLPPTPLTLARTPYWRFHPLGLEQRRAEVVRAAADIAERLEEIVDLSAEAARERLLLVRGIGPWTAAETMRVALGDPDAVSVGDYHVPSLVAWALAGEPRADDARMLELLEPYRGQRARVVQLLEASGLQPPRYGPRLRVRAIGGI
jgi:3-methyladenine DNA glycosylase/8-oxoguanine DNA glycosylase